MQVGILCFVKLNDVTVQTVAGTRVVTVDAQGIKSSRILKGYEGTLTASDLFSLCKYGSLKNGYTFSVLRFKVCLCMLIVYADEKPIKYLALSQ